MVFLVAEIGSGGPAVAQNAASSALPVKPVELVSNQALEIAFPGSASGQLFGAAVVSNCAVRGDVDAQVHYRLREWPSANGVRIGLSLQVAPPPTLFAGLGVVERTSFGNAADFPDQPREVYLTHFADGAAGMTATSHLAGTLRIVRQGSALTGFYYSGGQWVPIHSFSSATEDVHLALAAWSHDNIFGDQQVRLAFDNLVLNQGQLACADVTPPDTSIGSGPSQLTNSGGAAFTFSSDEAGSRFQCRLDGNEFSACSSPWSFTGLADGVHVFEVRAVDAAGNVDGSPAVFTWTVDTTPPVVSGAPSRAPDSNGWYSRPFLVSWSGEDALSGMGTCSAPSAYAGPDTAAGQLSGSCTDRAGNTAAASFSFQYDATAPTVTYSGNAGTYTVDLAINITCSATDNLSGIAGSVCANIVGPAYSFVLGSNGFSATATDRAGNAGSASTSFTVLVTYDGVCALARQSGATPGVAQSLCSKLRAAEASAARGNLDAKAGQLGAFKNEVSAQSGKALTADEAAVLTKVAEAL